MVGYKGLKNSIVISGIIFQEFFKESSNSKLVPKGVTFNMIEEK